MNSGRMPACDFLPYQGRQTTSVPDVLIGQNNIRYYHSMQHLVHTKFTKFTIERGNRCGHNPNRLKKPKFHAAHKRRPHVLEEAQRRIDQAISNIYLYPEFTKMFYHSTNKKGIRRRRRSESIEGAICLALRALLNSLNLKRMACGHYDKANRFIHYNSGYIVKNTDQSKIRVKRELKLLQEYEIIKINTKRAQRIDGSWETTQVEIEFTDKIFRMLNLMDEFLKDRETCNIKFHEKQRVLDKNHEKKNFYDKKSFNLHAKKDRLPAILKPIIKRIPLREKGDGYKIRDKIKQYVSQGLSVSDAMTLVKQQYPPS
jgi:hypothetical protein